MTLTAANGDELRLSTTGSYNLQTAFEQDQFIVVGGTGRFEGATGSGTILEQYALPGELYHDFEFTGTVDYKRN